MRNHRQFLIGAPFAILLLAYCSGAAPRSGYSVAEYRAALEATTLTPTVKPDSPEEQAAMDRFRMLYKDFTEDGLKKSARVVYADEAYFNDTIKTVRGPEAIADYLSHGAASAHRVEVEMQDVARAGRDYYFRWIMSIQLKADGDQIVSMGISQVRFDRAGRVVLHQDFWDSAAGLFDHLPGTGFLLRFYRGRL